MSSSAIHVTDAGGQTFSVEGCATIGDLKLSILEHTGIPVDRQQLARRETPGVEMVDATRLDGKDELALMVKDTNGGCEVAPFFLKIQGRTRRGTGTGEQWASRPRAVPRRAQRRTPSRAAARTAENEAKRIESNQIEWRVEAGRCSCRSRCAVAAESADLNVFLLCSARCLSIRTGQTSSASSGECSGRDSGGRSLMTISALIRGQCRAAPLCGPAAIQLAADRAVHAPAPIEICLLSCFPCRCLVCYSGMDWEWNKCQYCCIHGGCTVQ